jgi:olfactory receptor
MAQDHYVAICKPLLYSVIMNHRLCVQMTLASLLSSLVLAIVHTFKIFQLSFCYSSMVPQFFCDIPFAEVSCSDTFNNKLLILLSATVVSGSYFVFLVISYAHRLSNVLKFPVKREIGKAFSTFVLHFIVVSVFLCSGAYVYLSTLGTIVTLEVKEMILSVFYTIATPFFFFIHTICFYFLKIIIFLINS